MATYTKKMKSITVHTFFSDIGRTFSLTDTAESASASMALSDFLAYRDLNFGVLNQGSLANVTIPYHAVQYIEVTSTDTTVTKDDPYCES